MCLSYYSISVKYCTCTCRISVYLDLSHNRLRNLPDILFDSLQNLELLFLSNNQLKHDIELRSARLFNQLKQLQVLELRENNVITVPTHAFNLPECIKLDLSSNSITSWTSTSFALNVSDSLLDLSSNRVSLVNRSSAIGLHNRVNLSHNPFSCTCDLIWFRNWVNATQVELVDLPTYQCSAPEELKGKSLLDFHPVSIYARCFPPPWRLIIIGSVSSAVVLILLTFGLLYRYRWQLRLWRFRANLRRIQRSRAENLVEFDYDYDVFISCAEVVADKRWVSDELLKGLSGEGTLSDPNNVRH